MTGYTYGHIRLRYQYDGNEGALTATANTAYVGGMQGYGRVTDLVKAMSLSFSYCYNLGTITAKG